MRKNFDSLCKNCIYFYLQSESQYNTIFTINRKSDNLMIAQINTEIQKIVFMTGNVKWAEYTESTPEQLDEFNYLMYLTKYFGICQDEIMILDFLQDYYSRYKFIDIENCEKPALQFSTKKGDFECIEIDIHEDFSLYTTQKTLDLLKEKEKIFTVRNEIYIKPKPKK